MLAILDDQGQPAGSIFEITDLDCWKDVEISERLFGETRYLRLIEQLIDSRCLLEVYILGFSAALSGHLTGSKALSSKLLTSCKC